MITVNLSTMTVKRNKTVLISNGVASNGYVISNDPVSFEQLEELYEVYKHSVPNGVRYGNSYFKALSANELKTSDLIAGANRQKAKEELEMALVTGILNGSLVWPDDNKWFWQSERDSDFILLRDWFKKGKELCYQDALIATNQ